ncbi:MAG: 3-oxo-tetronate kinase [Terracidiphilus sp.]
MIADDFTGAGDIANTLAKGLGHQGGLAVAQYIRVPKTAASVEVEAGVISLKTRSAPARSAVEQSLEALEWLQQQGCRQFVFKYCSTFDSTPRGNIGPVGEALADRLGVRGVVACPAFPAAGRTVYQGHLFVNDRPLNESGMEHHPLTPMTDSDIRRWLTHQSRSPVGLIATPVVRSSAKAVRAALDAAAERHETLVITDATLDADLITIGEACANSPLLTGGSGIALALPANFIASGEAKGVQIDFEGIDGPEAILAGSCSGATRRQIDVHAQNHPVLAISVDKVMDGSSNAETLVDFLRQNRGREPLVFSSATPEDVAVAQTRFGRQAVSDRLDALFAEVAQQLVADGVRRLVVAGGETSGAIAQALDLGDLLIGPEIDPGVPIVISRRHDMALAFKSGNFGRPTFFAHALSALRGKES